MGQRKPIRNGWMPTAETQFTVGLAQGNIAYNVARSQAARGVPQHLAAAHGRNASTAILSFVFCVLPILVLTALSLRASNPLVTLWKVGQVLVGIIILMRLHRWVQEPASNRLSYRIPTWALVGAGGVSVFFYFVYKLVTGLL